MKIRARSSATYFSEGLLLAAITLIGSLAGAMPLPESETAYGRGLPRAETQYGGAVRGVSAETSYSARGVVTASKIGIISARPKSADFREYLSAIQRTALRLTPAALNTPPAFAESPNDQLLELQQGGASHFFFDAPVIEPHLPFLAAMKAVGNPIVVLTERAAEDLQVSQVVFEAWPVQALADELAAPGEERWISWISIGATGPALLESTTKALEDRQTIVQRWGPGASNPAEWVVVLGNWSDFPLWGDDYVAALRRDHPGARIALLATSDQADRLVGRGLLDLVVRPDWDMIFKVAARAVDLEDRILPSVIDPIIVRRSAAGQR